MDAFSPFLFNIYSESIFWQVLEERTEGITINGVVINNRRYAIHTALLTTNKIDLQALLTTIACHSEQMGLKLNTKKTKWLVISKQKIKTQYNITVGREEIERVASHTNFGS